MNLALVFREKYFDMPLKKNSQEVSGVIEFIAALCFCGGIYLGFQSCSVFGYQPVNPICLEWNFMESQPISFPHLSGSSLSASELLSHYAMLVVRAAHFLFKYTVMIPLQDVIFAFERQSIELPMNTILIIVGFVLKLVSSKFESAAPEA